MRRGSARSRRSADRRRGRATGTAARPRPPSTMFGSQAASHGGTMWPAHERLAEPEQHVVDEDDADADRRSWPACRRGGCWRRAPGRSGRRRGTRTGSRTSSGSRTARCADRCPRCSSSAARARSSGSTSRGRPAAGPSRGNTVSGIQAAAAVARTGTPRTSPARVGRVARAVLEHHFDGPLLAIDDDAARGAPGRSPAADRARLSAMNTSRPAAARRRDLADVEHEVGEVLEEDARPDLAFGAFAPRC